MVTWNVHKGLNPRLPGELRAMVDAREPTLLALQEARPILTLPPTHSGHHAASFRRGMLGPAEGVMTVSTVPVTGAHRVRSTERELFVLTPKAALISFVPVTDGRALCVINVHGLNFDPSGKQLSRQLDDLRAMVDHLDGPLIVTGDFNTWNDARLEAAVELASALGLMEVCADVPGGRKGHAPTDTIRRALKLDTRLHLDRLYVRGLVPLQATWLEEYTASDHVPLFARLDWSS